MSSINIGIDTIGSLDDSGNADQIWASKYSLIASATIQSLSFYVTSGAAGNMRLGIYNDVAGSPSARKAFTNAIALVNGWNTAAVTVPVLLSAASYWICYLYDNNSINFKKNSPGYTTKYRNFAYAALPDPFGAIDGTSTSAFSEYGTLTVVDTVKDLMNNSQSGFIANGAVYGGGILHLRRKV